MMMVPSKRARLIDEKLWRNDVRRLRTIEAISSNKISILFCSIILLKRMKSSSAA
jgi:hypothetical protein